MERGFPMIMNVAWVVLAVCAQASAGGTKIAVVDVPAVSDAYAKREKLEGEFEAMRARYREQVDGEKAEIDRQRRVLEEQFKPGSDDYEARKEEIILREARLKVYMDREGVRLDRIVNTSLRSIYDDIRAMVAKVAEEEGVDIVLAKDEIPPPSGANSDVLRQQIMLQKVLYFRPTVDLTAKVSERLNAEYQKAEAAAPPAAEPAAKQP
jgi:Skp family chaperone for outer membrane proteins